MPCARQRRQHRQLCVQLQQVVVLDGRAAARLTARLGLSRAGQGARPPVKVLGRCSLPMCGAVLAAWGALRQQQQQELVESVVSAVGMWKEGQQQVVVGAAGSKRLHL
jgi:hypothetical protein